MEQQGHHLTLAFDASRIVPSVGLVSRYFGGSRYRPKGGIPGEIQRATESASRLIEPRGAIAVLGVSSCTDHGVLRLAGGHNLNLPCFNNASKPRSLAAAVATLGPGLEDRCRRLAAEGQVYQSTLLDAVGTAMLDRLEQQLRGILEEYGHDADQFAGPRFAPGLEGYPLEHQAGLFAMVSAEAIGVRLNEAYIMDPVKSISFFQLFLSEPYQGEVRLKCKQCSLTQCLYRRA